MRDVRPVPSFNSHNKATDNNNNSKRPQAREKLRLHSLACGRLYIKVCMHIPAFYRLPPVGPSRTYDRSEQSMVRRLLPLSIGCRQHLIIIIEHLGMAACKGYVDKAVGSQLQIAEIHPALA